MPVGHQSTRADWATGLNFAGVTLTGRRAHTDGQDDV
jgi:hypothetical protein